MPRDAGETKRKLRSTQRHPSPISLECGGGVGYRPREWEGGGGEGPPAAMAPVGEDRGDGERGTGFVHVRGFGSAPMPPGGESGGTKKKQG